MKKGFGGVAVVDVEVVVGGDCTLLELPAVDVDDVELSAL